MRLNQPDKRRLLKGILVAIVLFPAGFYLWHYVKFVVLPTLLPSAPREIIVGTIPKIPSNTSRILLLMIDGLALEPFADALSQNHLPNVSRLIQTRPTLKTEAISTFPSATSPSVPELVSGRYAEIENLPSPGAVHAFDRQQRRVIRYVTNPDSWQWPVVTLFDATKDLSAITVFEGRWDGPKSILTQFNMARQAVLETIGAHGLTEGDRGPVEAFLKAIQSDEPPVVSLVVLNDFDMAAHFYGPESSKAREALISADGFIGQILDTLEKTSDPHHRSLLDQTNIILFGDHGHARSGEFVDLVKFFKHRDLKAFDVSTIPHVVFRERLGTLWTEWPDVIMVSGGSNVSQLYLKQVSGDWQRPAASDDQTTMGIDLASLASDIVRTPGIDQVLWNTQNGDIAVVSAESRPAYIKVSSDSEQKRFAYIIADDAQQDPFGYLEHAETRNLICYQSQLTDACFHTRTEWFDKSFKSLYPGAIPLIPKAFHPQRFTGDLMITLKPGYTFIRGQKGDHGNLYRDAVITPLILNGPGITPCEESHRPRLVDLYPSVAVLLGADPADPSFKALDGRVLDCVLPPRQD